MPSLNSFPTVVLTLAIAIAGAPAQAQPLSAEVMNKAKSNCLTAVAKTVNKPRSSLRIIKARSDASGASVDIQVPTAQAPWACLTSPKGEVEDVYFNG
ncbi:MAG: hypothetical protein VKL58_04865 [Cyanobacteriota bacterium]|nr:hypothetical protein [Cyanobacteriota bacterium]